MHRATALVLLAFPLLAYSQSCPITEESIAGTWERRGRTGDFEQMELTIKGNSKVFNSWLHERPDMLDARWALVGCTLQILAAQSNAPALVYRLRMNGKNELELKASGEAAARYGRMKRAP